MALPWRSRDPALRKQSLLAESLVNSVLDGFLADATRLSPCGQTLRGNIQFPKLRGIEAAGIASFCYLKIPSPRSRHADEVGFYIHADLDRLRRIKGLREQREACYPPGHRRSRSSPSARHPIDRRETVSWETKFFGMVDTPIAL
jgi:hypothetical protein